MRPESAEIKRFLRAWMALMDNGTVATATDDGDGYVTLRANGTPMLKVADTGAVFGVAEPAGTALVPMGNLERMTVSYKKIAAARGK